MAVTEWKVEYHHFALRGGPFSAHFSFKLTSCKRSLKLDRGHDRVLILESKRGIWFTLEEGGGEAETIFTRRKKEWSDKGYNLCVAVWVYQMFDVMMLNKCILPPSDHFTCHLWGCFNLLLIGIWEPCEWDICNRRRGRERGRLSSENEQVWLGGHREFLICVGSPLIFTVDRD